MAWQRCKADFLDGEPLDHDYRGGLPDCGRGWCRLVVGVHPAVVDEPKKGARRCEEDVVAGPIMGDPGSKRVRIVTKTRGVTADGRQKQSWLVRCNMYQNFDWVRSGLPLQNGQKRDDKINLEKRGCMLWFCFFVFVLYIGMATVIGEWCECMIPGVFLGGALFPLSFMCIEQNRTAGAFLFFASSSSFLSSIEREGLREIPKSGGEGEIL